MKILFISMPSIHVIRWIENLKDTSFELFWFDVLDKGELKTISSVEQLSGWKKRKIGYIKGEYFLKKKWPNLYEKIQPFLEVTANEQLEIILQEIQPDIVHSFEMQSCSYPIIKTMKKYPNFKWIYSCWGNDLFFYQNLKFHKLKIKQVLNRVDFLHTDCLRDYEIAKSLGFKGKHTGVIPGGTGYKLDEFELDKESIENRKVILVKGYEHLFGRGLNVVKALKEIQDELNEYQIVIFGAHPSVIKFVTDNKLPFKAYDRHGLAHDAILQLMGKSLIYVGNSISDGMANTLLEAIVMGAFPIQSNPGGVTSEIILHGKNGFLINNPENVNEIKLLIKQALTNSDLLEKAFEINSILAEERLEYEVIKNKVIALYNNHNE